MCDDSPSSLVPRSAFYDIEAPAQQQQCSPRKAARLANGERGAGGDLIEGTMTTTTTNATSAIATKPSPPKRVSFASHVQVSSSCSSSSSSRSRKKEKPKKTKGGDDDDDDDEGDGVAANAKIALSVLLLVAACAVAAGCLFAAGWSARGRASPSTINRSKSAIVEDQRWQAAPSRGETVLGALPNVRELPKNLFLSPPTLPGKKKTHLSSSLFLSKPFQKQ